MKPPIPKHPDHDQLLAKLKQGQFSFIDLGCGTGESISHCEKQFGLGPGIGFDIDPEKIRSAIANNYPAILADVTQESFEGNLVRFCTMMDFLEHLPSEEYARKILAHLKDIARDFLFIRHPSFEDIDYLGTLGLKIGWTHWSGHTNMMRIDDFHRLFAELGLNDYCIIPRKLIISSAHPSVVPITAKINSTRYDSVVHGTKKHVFFNRPIWTQFDIYVRLRGSFPTEEWEKVIATSLDHNISAQALEKLEHETQRRRAIEQNLVTELEKRRHLQVEIAKLTKERRDLIETREALACQRKEGLEKLEHETQRRRAIEQNLVSELENRRRLQVEVAKLQRSG